MFVQGTCLNDLISFMAVQILGCNNNNNATITNSNIIHVAESEQSVHSCFVGVISSHGENGVIFGSDGRPVRLGDIYSQFGGPVMAGKNKLFLVQVRITSFHVYLLTCAQ